MGKKRAIFGKFSEVWAYFLCCWCVFNAAGIFSVLGACVDVFLCCGRVLNAAGIFSMLWACAGVFSMLRACAGVFFIVMQSSLSILDTCSKTCPNYSTRTRSEDFCQILEKTQTRWSKTRTWLLSLSQKFSPKSWEILRKKSKFFSRFSRSFNNFFFVLLFLFFGTLATFFQRFHLHFHSKKPPALPKFLHIHYSNQNSNSDLKYLNSTLFFGENTRFDSTRFFGTRAILDSGIL